MARTGVRLGAVLVVGFLALAADGCGSTRAVRTNAVSAGSTNAPNGETASTAGDACSQLKQQADLLAHGIGALLTDASRLAPGHPTAVSLRKDFFESLSPFVPADLGGRVDRLRAFYADVQSGQRPDAAATYADTTAVIAWAESSCGVDLAGSI